MRDVKKEGTDFKLLYIFQSTKQCFSSDNNADDGGLVLLLVMLIVFSGCSGTQQEKSFFSCDAVTKTEVGYYCSMCFSLSV